MLKGLYLCFSDRLQAQFIFSEMDHMKKSRIPFVCLAIVLCVITDLNDPVFGDTDNGNEDSGTLVGTLAKRGAYSYVAVMFRDGRQTCGGTLVGPNHILTAANCVAYLNKKDIPLLNIQLNTVTLKTFNPGVVESKVVAFKFHEKYNRSTKENDIALVKLASNVTTLYPINLQTDGSQSLEGKSATILRWGFGNVAGSTIKQRVLLQADVSIISNQNCTAEYSKFSIFNTSLCASNKATVEGECQDDSSGGPIIVGGRQVGIASWGKGCMDSKFPGVYTRISAYTDWIASNLDTF